MDIGRHERGDRSCAGAVGGRSWPRPRSCGRQNTGCLSPPDGRAVAVLDVVGPGRGIRSYPDRARLRERTFERAVVGSRIGTRRVSKPAAIQPAVQGGNGTVTREGNRTAARRICTADDGGWALLRRGNCQEERFWKSRADAAFVCAGIRTTSTNNSTHSKRFVPVSSRWILLSRY